MIIEVIPEIKKKTERHMFLFWCSCYRVYLMDRESSINNLFTEVREPKDLRTFNPVPYINKG